MSPDDRVFAKPLRICNGLWVRFGLGRYTEFRQQPLEIAISRVRQRLTGDCDLLLYTTCLPYRSLSEHGGPCHRLRLPTSKHASCNHFALHRSTAARAAHACADASLTRTERCQETPLPPSRHLPQSAPHAVLASSPPRRRKVETPASAAAIARSSAPPSCAA